MNFEETSKRKCFVKLCRTRRCEDQGRCVLNLALKQDDTAEEVRIQHKVLDILNIPTRDEAR